MNLRLLILKLRNSQSWSTCKFLVVIGYVIFMVLTVAYLFKKTSSVSDENQENSGNFDRLKDLGDVPAEVLEFEAKVGNVFLYLWSHVLIKHFVTKNSKERRRKIRQMKATSF